MGAGKSHKQGGFTKAANAQRFVRNRDKILKDKEVNKEANIHKKMCEGICNKCRDIVRWKFHYAKYKPLRVPAVCQDCKQKCVTKAYRALCDKCASKRKACPSCLTTNFNNTHKEMNLPGEMVHEDELEEEEAEDTSGKVTKKEKKNHYDDFDDFDDFDDMDDDEEEDEEDEEDSVEDNKAEEDNQEEDEEEEEEQTNSNTAAALNTSTLPNDTLVGNSVFTASLSAAAADGVNIMGQWNEKKYQNVASAKYSKARVAGSVEDVNNSNTYIRPVVEKNDK